MENIHSYNSMFKQNFLFDTDFNLCSYTSNKSVINYLNPKTEKDFNKSTLDIINIVTLEKDHKLLPVGSASYSIHKYPGDIDLMEKIEGKDYLNVFRKRLVNKFKRMVRRIEETHNKELPIFITDFKAGHDSRYDFYIGELDKVNGVVRDYDQSIIEDELNNLYSQKLITQKELSFILDKIEQFEDPPTLENFYELNNFLKELRTIRWTPDEIIEGYKLLRGGKIMQLYDALIMNSIVKLDVIAPIQYDKIVCRNSTFEHLSRYTEVTNWFYIKQINPITNESKELTSSIDYKKGLLNDIYKYSNEEDPEYNILKAAKRLWSYGAFLVKSGLDVNTGNGILKLISPIMDSYIAILNSTKADLEVLEIVLRKDLDIPHDYIKLSVESIAVRLACYSGIDNNVNITKQILTMLDPVKDDFDVQSLNETMKFIKKIITKLTSEYLKCKGVNIRKILSTL